MICLRRKTIYCSAEYIIFNEIKNKIFLDALSKSDARWDGKQEILFIWPKRARVNKLQIKDTARFQANQKRKHIELQSLVCLKLHSKGPLIFF